MQANGKYVLLHQPIRQYVMANILVRHLGSSKSIVPFMVVEDIEKAKRELQVHFMICQGWLKEGNILTWNSVEGYLRA